MVSVYRMYIGTEDNSYKKVVTALNKGFGGFTITKAEGFWKEEGEIVSIDSYVVDIVGYVSFFKKKIKELEEELKQKRIMVLKSDMAEVN